MTFSHDLALAAPELILAVGTLGLLVIGAFCGLFMGWIMGRSDADNAIRGRGGKKLDEIIQLEENGKLGLVKLGGKAEVVVDAYPDRKLQAKITEVNQQAEYNPRLSLTQKERSNMVFWIKVSVENSDGILKPGMPADVTLD